MESWRDVFRRGIVPLLSTEQLEAARDALRDDDYRLLQGATTTPPPLQCVQDWPVEAACFLGYCGAVKFGGFVKNLDGSENKSAATVADCEEFFALKCFECDQLIGEPAAVRWFLNWHDDTPRDEMRRELLIEVNRALAARLGAEDDTEPDEPLVVEAS